MKNNVIFGVSALLLVAAFMFGSSYYKKQQAEKIGFMAQENAAMFVRPHSMTSGSEDAKVVLVEFMDPACETCAAFSPFVKQIMNTYPGKIRLVLRYAPFHDGADYFVKILEAAKKQGKYWQTLELMFKTQPYWTSHHVAQPDKVWPFLAKAGLNIDQLRRDMTDPAIAQLIEQDLADADALEVRKTPGYFVNGKPLQVFGSQELLALVKSELNRNYPPQAQ